MSYVVLLTAVLVGPQANPSGDIWREDYRALLAITKDRAHPQPEEVVPRLVAMYEALEDLDAIPKYERTRMRRTLEGRMIKQLEILVHDQIRRDRRARRNSLAGGSAASMGAQQLINIIVTTISPDSWQQNGGNATITYYPINPALVVRAPGEVHEQVTALLQALPK